MAFSKKHKWQENENLVEVLRREEVVADVPGVVGQLAIGTLQLGISVTDFTVLNNLSEEQRALIPLPNLKKHKLYTYDISNKSVMRRNLRYHVIY